MIGGFAGGSRDSSISSKPNCSEIFELDFSMQTYDHLSSVRERAVLESEPEPDIIDVLKTITGVEDLNDFGNAVNLALQENRTSWILYSLASYFWRGEGKALEAVECIRRSLHFTPRQYQYIPLASLGNVLHRSHRSEDAVIVLKNAININPSNPGSYFTLGNVHAILAEYDLAAAAFEKAVSLDPTFTQSQLRLHAVKCHQQLDRALRAQHE